MKKKFTLFAITLILFGWSSNSKLSAQNNVAYYREVYYTLDTIYQKPKSNTIEINVGGQYDMGNYGPYAYGRVHVSRFLVSGVVSMMPGTGYGIQEGNVVFCFKGSSEKKALSDTTVEYNGPNGTSNNNTRGDATTKTTTIKTKTDNKPRATTEDVGTEPVKFKTGGKNKIISPQSYSYKTSTEDVSYRGPTANAPGGSQVTTTTTTTHSGTANAVTKYKNTCWLQVPKFTYSGLSAGVYHWARPNKVTGITNVTGFSLGLGASINKKAKYRFHYEERENDVTVLGLGQYETKKTDRIHKKGTKIRRVNSSIDVGLEFLYSPMVLFDTTQTRVFAANDTIGHMEDIKKKNFGFRIRTEIRKGPISMRYELGFRPGLKNKLADMESADKNFFTKHMSGAYILVGIGFGIGLL